MDVKNICSNIGKFLLKRKFDILLYLILGLFTFIFIYPLIIIFINSLKIGIYIKTSPFSLPNVETFYWFKNYTKGLKSIDFFGSIALSFWVTITSVLAILLLTSMAAWFIIRVKNKFTNILYYAFVFSMIVPFQMIMFTMSRFADILHINNPIGIILLYVGFGSGLSVFMFAGFIKSIPLEIEEAACIDGCNTIKTYFFVVLPILKSTAITIAILNAMWIWNDYLLPNLIFNFGTDFKTLPMAVCSAFQGSYGNVDMGGMMAMLVISIVPIIIFYVLCQKHIIKGVVAGAVKG